MTRKELEEYIDNSILMGNVITEDIEAYYNRYLDFIGVPGRAFVKIFCEQLLGSVCVNDIFYFKKDQNNNIHLLFLDVTKCTSEAIEIDLGDTVDIIDDNFLMNFKNLKSISGESVVSIGKNCFLDNALESINFPNLREIGENSFLMSEKLRHVELNKLKVLPKNVFKGCLQLESCRGDEVEVVEKGAFANCRNLKTIIVPKLSKRERKNLRRSARPHTYRIPYYK